MNIVYEEDIQKMFQKTVTIMGEIGRFIYPTTKTTYTNVVLCSNTYGRLWYGDIDAGNWATALAALTELDDSAGWCLEAMNT